MDALLTRQIRRYGWRPSLPGSFDGIADTAGLRVETEVDLRTALPPVFDQGQLGSCTANATACAFQWDAILDGKFDGPLSRLWIYYGERKIEGTLGQGDTGAEGHDAYTVASTLGIPPESAWPYDISTFQGPIPALATKDETYYKLTKPVHAVPQTETAIKQVLSNKQLVTFGFTVYESFESQAVAETGIVPMPAKGEKILGGHEIAVVGYLAAHPQHALVRNSWGPGWGLKGYALFPWAYLASRSLSSDLRTIVRPAGK